MIIDFSIRSSGSNGGGGEKRGRGDRRRFRRLRSPGRGFGIGRWGDSTGPSAAAHGHPGGRRRVGSRRGRSNTRRPVRPSSLRRQGERSVSRSPSECHHVLCARFRLAVSTTVATQKKAQC